MPYYINIKSKVHGVETIDEFNSKNQAQAMLREYQKAYHGDTYCYISTRSTKEWREG